MAARSSPASAAAASQARDVVVLEGHRCARSSLVTPATRGRTPGHARRDRRRAPPAPCAGRCRRGRWSRRPWSHPCRSSEHGPVGMRHHRDQVPRAPPCTAPGRSSSRPPRLRRAAVPRPRVAVAEHHRPPAAHEVDILAPVDVPDAAAFRAGEELRIAFRSSAPRSDAPTCRRG